MCAFFVLLFKPDCVKHSVGIEFDVLAVLEVPEVPTFVLEREIIKCYFFDFFWFFSLSVLFKTNLLELGRLLL